MEHEDIQLTGAVEYQVKEIDSAEYGPLGASSELHLLVRPSPVPAWRGLWSADFGAPEVITGRTIVNDTGYITLGLGDKEDLASDIAAVREHLAKTNRQWREFNERAQRAAVQAAAILAGG